MGKVAAADTVAAAAAVVGRLVVRALVDVVGKKRFGAIAGLGADKRGEATVLVGTDARPPVANGSCSNSKYNNNTPTSWLVKFTKRSY